MYSLNILCLSFLSDKKVSAFLPIHSVGFFSFFFFFLHDITQQFGGQADCRWV